MAPPIIHNHLLLPEFLETNPCGSPASSYRQIVLEAVRSCLESSNSRLVSLGVSGLQRIVRDDRFHSRPADRAKVDDVGDAADVADEESWMTVQILSAVHTLNTLSDEHQQEILKVWVHRVYTQLVIP